MSRQSPKPAAHREDQAMSFRHQGMVAAVLVSALLSGCSSDTETKPMSLASSAQLQQDKDQRDKWTYRAPRTGLPKFRRFQFEPVVVYGGPDGGFGSMPTADRQRLAGVVGQEFTKVIGEKYPVVNAQGPDVARIRVT